MIDDPALNPERLRIESAVAYCEKRVSRAAIKQRSASREMREALDALEDQTARLDAWKLANPDPQIEMPL